MQETTDSTTEVTYTLKHIYCHNPNCITCTQGKGHGPYWYANFSLAGKTVTIFLGKEFKPLDFDRRYRKNSGKTTEKNETVSNRNSTRNSFPKDSISRRAASQKFDVENRFNSQNASQVQNRPPSRQDFERDLLTLKKQRQNSILKSVYRRLTKKYHPDRYPGNVEINAWMAEINGQYQQLKKTALR